MTTSLPASTRRCRACLSTDVRVHHASRATGFSVLACRSCGAHMMFDPPSVDELAAMGDTDAEEYSAWTERLRSHAVEDSHRAVLDRLSDLVGSKPDRSLFDLGAGAGGFLSQARDAGFRPAGNDLSKGAVEVAAERYGIDLLHGDLSQFDDPGQHDALTMWCVLAHVPDGDQMLRDAVRALKPGGVLYLQTPRWSSMDQAGLAALDVTRGRATRIVDRRVALHHMIHHTQRSLTATLQRAGLEIIDVEAVPRYSLTTVDYLESLRVPAGPRKVAGGLIDSFVERGWFFRNVLDGYARKPA